METQGASNDRVNGQHILDDCVFRDYRFNCIEKCGIFTKYHFSGADGSGEGTMLRYDIMPGIHMTYDSLRMKSCFQSVEPDPGHMELHYCMEGGFEFELRNGQVSFLGEGDICVSNPWNGEFAASRLPQEYYRGVTIHLLISEAQRSLDKFFPSSGIDISQMEQHLLTHRLAFILHSRPEIGRVFTDLYTVDERIMQPYCATKIIELLLLLQLSQQCGEYQTQHFSQSVVERTKNVYRHLMTHQGGRICVHRLADQFCVAESTLQQCFKCIYGKPIATFFRQQQMHRSALLLQRQPTLSIGEVAQMAGYDNQSKFSAAFKAVIGQTPLAYRRSVLKEEGISE